MNNVREFFSWLALEDGFRSKIKSAHLEWLRLSRKDRKAAQAAPMKKHPSFEELERAVAAMPKDTAVQMRDRTVMIMLALTQGRDGALPGLPISALDVDKMVLTMKPNDGSATKFSKLIETALLPFWPEMEKELAAYVDMLKTDLGFGPDDPLFPKTTMGQDENDRFAVTGLAKEPWANASPIRKIYREAFAAIGLDHRKPHAVRSTMASWAIDTNQPITVFKALSQNLGHDHIDTTLTSYAKLPVEKQVKLVRGLSLVGSAQSDDLDVDGLDAETLKMAKTIAALKKAGMI